MSEAIDVFAEISPVESIQNFPKHRLHKPAINPKVINHHFWATPLIGMWVLSLLP